MPLKTLFLNPPSFENFDGGASSRWPATREIESYWYPVWLAYPAGMLEGSRLLDAPPHHIDAQQTIEIGKKFEFLVLFTSTPGFPGDMKLATAMKAANPELKIAFVGPHVTTLPEQSLKDCPAIDFVVRREFDYAVVDFANGKSLDQIAGVSYRGNGKIVHNPDSPSVADLDALPRHRDPRLVRGRYLAMRPQRNRARNNGPAVTIRRIPDDAAPPGRTRTDNHASSDS